MDDRPRKMRMALPFAAIGLLAFVVAGAAVFGARGAIAQGPDVQIGSGSGLVGDSVTVHLEALNVVSPGLAAFTIDVGYDHAVISPTDCVADPDDLFNVSPLCNTAYGQPPTVVRCVGASTTGVQGSPLLCDITFEILAVGCSDLTLDVAEFANPTGAPIAFVTSDGSICGVTATNTPTATATRTPVPPTATRTATATRTPTRTSTPCPDGICPTATPATHHRERTNTPKPSATATTSAPTSAPTVPQVTPPVPTSTPSGGAGPNIIAPPTGSGDGNRPAAWTYGTAVGALAALAAGAFAVAVRRRRHSE